MQDSWCSKSVTNKIINGRTIIAVQQLKKNSKYQYCNKYKNPRCQRKLVCRGHHKTFFDMNVVH